VVLTLNRQSYLGTVRQCGDLPMYVAEKADMFVTLG
jgi:hypothetical protein